MQGNSKAELSTGSDDESTELFRMERPKTLRIMDPGGEISERIRNEDIKNRPRVAVRWIAWVAAPFSELFRELERATFPGERKNLEFSSRVSPFSFRKSFERCYKLETLIIHKGNLRETELIYTFLKLQNFCRVSTCSA